MAREVNVDAGGGLGGAEARTRIADTNPAPPLLSYLKRRLPWQGLPWQGLGCRANVRHYVYWKTLGNGDIGIDTILHERMHQMDRFRDDVEV